MEFYAAESAKGGVLEPEGIVDIKFRRQDLHSAMKRTIPGGFDDDEAKRKALMPTFKQLAVHFAALHDTPGVMLHKEAIKDIIPWQTSREFSRFDSARLAEERIKSAILATGASRDRVPALISSVAHVITEIVADFGGDIEPETHADVAAMLRSI